MSLITLDYETYFDDKVSLKKLTTLDYVSHPDFKVHMLSIKEGDKPSILLSEEEIPDALEHYFHKGNKNTMLAHNTAFEGLVTQKIYGFLANEYRDTQLMFRGLAPYMSHSLENMLISLFPNDETKRKGKELAQSKGVRDLTSVDGLYDSIGEYCITDSELCYAAHEFMLQFFPESELRIIDQTLKMWIDPCFILDATRVARHLKNIEKHKRDTIVKAAQHGVTQKQLSSNPQFAAWLESRDIKVPMKFNDKGKETYAFAKNDLDFMALQSEYPELSDVWRARIEVKSTQEVTRSKRLLNNAEKDNGYLRIALNYYGAHTGRYSGGEKINPQNLKRGSELRLALTAEEGNFVYVADLSQIEARVNAALSGEWDLVEDFRRGVDIYSKFAGENIYNRPVDRKKPLTNDKGQYLNKDGEIVESKDDAHFPDYLEGFVGKVAVLGLGYQMSAGLFRLTLATGAMGPPVNISEQEANAIVYRGYRKKYRNIVRNWSIAERHLRGMMQKDYDEMWGPLRVLHQRILLPNGMFLNYPQLSYEEHHDGTMSFSYWNGRFMNGIYGGKLVENVVQALAQVIVKEQVLECLDAQPDMRFALQVHDENIFVGPADNAKERMNKILEVMSTPPSWWPELPIAAEGGFAQNYSK